MESYIVRIYRREHPDAIAGREIVGYLETPVTGNRYPFHNARELLQMLAHRLGCPLQNELSLGKPPTSGIENLEHQNTNLRRTKP